MQDSETPDQGLMVITAVPLVMEIVPAGGIRMSFGNQAVAEEVAEAYASWAPNQLAGMLNHHE